MVMGIGLGMDAMSVSAAIGVKWNGPHQKFRLAWHMGLSQFLMPCAGYLAGKPLAGFLSDYGRYAAAGLVLALGIKMLYEAIESHPGAMAESVERAEERVIATMIADPTRGWSLIAVSVATSLDALVLGFSLALRGGSTSHLTWSHLLYDSSIIGLIACVMALIGVNIGQKLGKAFGRQAEIAGAIVLILLAITFVVF
jgi:putative Mn2+ efflux pump MntP